MYKKLILGVFVFLVGLVLMQGVSATGPTLNSIADQTATEDQVFTLDVTLSEGADNGTVIFSDDTELFNIQKLSDTTGRVYFTPTNDNVGVHTIKITAADTNSSDEDTFQLNVQNVNDAPALNLPNTLTTKINVDPNYQVLATDVDAGDILTFSAVSDDWEIFPITAGGLISFIPDEIDLGLHYVTITVADGDVNVSDTMKFLITEECDDGMLLIEDVDLDDKTGDDDQLEPGDILEIDFEVRNKLTTKEIDDVEVEAWIEDSDGDRITDKVEIEINNIGEKDSENAEITLKIDPDASKGTYILFIEAKGEDDGGQDRCDTHIEEVKIKKEDHRLLLESVTLIPSMSTCGGKIEVSTHVYNIGETDEDDIKLKIKSTDLGIETYSEEFELDDRDDVTKIILVNIPATAKAGNYWIEVIANFNDGDDQASSDLVPITITCGEVVPEETVEATGASVINVPSTRASAEIGKTIKFTTTLTNNGDTTVTYTMSLSDVSSWAEGIVEPTTMTLTPGSNMPVYVYITPKSASVHTAVLSVYADGQLAATKTLTIEVLGDEEEVGTVSPGIETTDWGHGVSISQTKALIKDYIGMGGLVILVALLAVLGLMLYWVNNRVKPKVTYIVDKKKKGRKKR